MVRAVQHNEQRTRVEKLIEESAYWLAQAGESIAQGEFEMNEQGFLQYQQEILALESGEESDEYTEEEEQERLDQLKADVEGFKQAHNL